MAKKTKKSKSSKGKSKKSAGKSKVKKSAPKKTPPHLVLRKAAEDEIKRNKANMRRATVREGLLAEAGVQFPHLTVHDRVASGKGIWETDEEREARATQTARATSMAIAKAGGIKEWNEKIDKIVKETENKEDPDDDGGKKTKKRVKTKEKPIVIKDKDVLEDEDTSRGRVKLTPKMTGGSEYLATDYDRPAFQDWSDLEPPNMPGLLGSAKAQQDLLGSGMAAYQTWAQPAIEYQPPVGPTYATRASLLGSSPAEVAAAESAAAVNNRQNNRQNVDPNSIVYNWTDSRGIPRSGNFMEFTRGNQERMYPGSIGTGYNLPWIQNPASTGTREVYGQGDYNFPAPHTLGPLGGYGGSIPVETNPLEGVIGRSLDGPQTGLVGYGLDYGGGYHGK
jgi:hypothetical protein